MVRIHILRSDDEMTFTLAEVIVFTFTGYMFRVMIELMKDDERR